VGKLVCFLQAPFFGGKAKRGERFVSPSTQKCDKHFVKRRDCYNRIKPEQLELKKKIECLREKKIEWKSSARFDEIQFLGACGAEMSNASIVLKIRSSCSMAACTATRNARDEFPRIVRHRTFFWCVTRRVVLGKGPSTFITCTTLAALVADGNGKCSVAASQPLVAGT
jgi:hypothetical protein